VPDQPPWFSAFDVTLVDLQEAAAVMAELYTRGPIQYLPLSEDDKNNPLLVLDPALSSALSNAREPFAAATSADGAGGGNGNGNGGSAGSAANSVPGASDASAASPTTNPNASASNNTINGSTSITTSSGTNTNSASAGDNQTLESSSSGPAASSISSSSKSGKGDGERNERTSSVTNPSKERGSGSTTKSGVDKSEAGRDRHSDKPQDRLDAKEGARPHRNKEADRAQDGKAPARHADNRDNRDNHRPSERDARDEVRQQ